MVLVNADHLIYSRAMARTPLKPGEIGQVTVTKHRSDDTPTEGRRFAYAVARANVGLPHSGRKRISARGATVAEAREALATKAASAVEQDDLANTSTRGKIPPTWNAAVSDQRRRILSDDPKDGRRYSEGTKRTYTDAIDNWLLSAPFGDERLASITTQQVEDWLNSIANSERWQGGRRIGGEGIAKTVRSIARLIFKRAVKDRVVPISPMADLDKISRSAQLVEEDKRKRASLSPSADATRAHDRAFTKEERASVLSVVASKGRCQSADVSDLVVFLMATGMRVGEALALTWEHVHLDASVPHVDVRGTAQRVGGKGMGIYPPKTEGSVRSVEIGEGVAGMLAKRWERMADPQCEDPLPLGPLNLVFPTVNGTLRDPSNLNKIMRGLFEEAGVNWATIHTFRRTSANMGIDAGAPRQRMAQRLGHSTETMDRYYMDDTTMQSGLAALVEEDLFEYQSGQ